MSITVMFGFFPQGEATGPCSAFLFDLSSIAEKYGFGTETRIEALEEDVREGVRNFIDANHFRWSAVLALVAPKEGKANTAFPVYEEINKKVRQVESGRFFQLLPEVVGYAHTNMVGVDLFFGGEWMVKDSIRFMEGTLEDFLNLSSVEGGIILSYMDPLTGVIQQHPDVPTVFRFLPNLP